MTNQLPVTLFNASLSDEPDNKKAVTMHLAEQVFTYFKNAPLFRWGDANNDCENRANAICILLDEWGIPNYKGWVFSGFFIKKNYGSLIHSWKYHVAALLPVQNQNSIEYFIIDPSTLSELETIKNWALKITEKDDSYHFIKSGDCYIFPTRKIKKDNWYKRNKRNYKWTMQGLYGINGLSPRGKAKLAFNKKAAKKAKDNFTKLKNEQPDFLKSK